MNPTNKTFLASLAIAVLALDSPAMADDVSCPPDLGAVTIDGNVLVAAPCELNGTTVKGNVHLYAGGSLLARNARIDGNIQAENAFEIDVSDSEIGGSIQLDDLVGDVTVIVNNRVDGSIQLKSNRSRLDVVDNVVGADIQAFGNTGGVDISGNAVDGNLQCKENAPAPTGGNNDVQGNKEDQCADLVAASSGDQGTGTATAGGNAGDGVQASAAAADDSAGAGSAGPLMLGMLLLVLAARLRGRTAA